MKYSILNQLFRKWSGKEPDTIQVIPGSGSARKYFRLQSGSLSAIGVYSPDDQENRAFLSFTQHFLSHRMPVPEILAEDLREHAYLLTDLGNQSLFSLVEEVKGNGQFFSGKLEKIYQKVLNELIRFQIVAGRDLDYSVCYPRQVFDSQSMMWDLNYFKYYFLKTAAISFDEQKLEEDFAVFTDFLTQADHRYFMYRDFQSRNILLVDSEPYFIDYQGGRQGPLHYDLASLLFQAKAGLPEDFRNRLTEYYLDRLSDHVSISRNEFSRYFHGFILLRMIQVLGAYGFRGLYEGKSHFILSIPHAIANLRWFLDHMPLPVKVPELQRALTAISASNVYPINSVLKDMLVVSICSFAFKNGIPRDHSGHGGGYVFDCRALPNPGREERFQHFTGKDLPVRLFMEEQEQTAQFLSPVYQLVDHQIDLYLERSFSHLMVSFGCTGGQHRSVYCAEKLAEHIKGKYPVHIELIHTEQNNWM